MTHEHLRRIRAGRRTWTRHGLTAIALLTTIGCGDAFLLPTPAPGVSEEVDRSLVARTSPPLKTRWTDSVSTSAPHQEYPRPQMVRPDWQNLNGQWQFAPAAEDQALPVGESLAETVVVPFPIESALSGIQRHEDRMWYRREFTVPSTWAARRVVLNFGAVDWRASVYVNGQLVGAHDGGYDAFSLDITSALNGGTNELIVRVEDLSEVGGGAQVNGKQRLQPAGTCFYTAVSGIWQTVWLEPVPTSRITKVDTTPSLAAKRLTVRVDAAEASGLTVEAIATTNGATVATATGAAGTAVSMSIPNPHAWAPTDPFLYDLKVRLRSGTTVVDEVSSYFGMRDIALAKVDGILRPVLNGKFVPQLGTLDQGYWPDGLYTAPSDEALRFDLQEHKDLGFNMVRKHVKVEPQRWYYWADRLGLLVWQDMPSMSATPTTAAEKQQFEGELRKLVDEHRNAPSVIMWVPFNEGWGEYDVARIATLVNEWDPSRLVDNMSGVSLGTDGGNGSVIDSHAYWGPESPTPTGTRAAVLGEFGGLGRRVSDHEWSPGQGTGYDRPMESNADLTDTYVGLLQHARMLVGSPGLSAAVYTQITDVENEVNGLMTYDRAVEKADMDRVRNENALFIATALPSGLLPLSTLKSFQAATPGYTNRYMRHENGDGLTSVVDTASADLLKQDATFRIVPGLADLSCYSLESLNYPGEYLRHGDDLRVRKDRRDRSSSFDRTATFCAKTALNGTAQVSLEALDHLGHYVRHRGGELWLDPSEATSLYQNDASWQVVDGWATRRFVNQANNSLCLGVRGNDLHRPGTEAEVYSCAASGDPTQDERWYTVPTSDGYFQMVNSVSGLCLGLLGISPPNGGNAFAAGTLAEVYTCTPNREDSKRDQEWRLVSVSGDSTVVQIQNRAAADLCLGVVGRDRPTSGATVQVSYCGNDPSDDGLDERWSVTQ